MNSNEVDKNEIDATAPIGGGEAPSKSESESESGEVSQGGLTTREALEKAVAEVRKPSAAAGETKSESGAAATPSKAAVKDAIADRPEPPSEFSAAGKKAWSDGDVVGVQKEFRRIHDARTQEITRAQRAEREAVERSRVWKELGDKAAPYIQARGKDGVSPEKAIMEALALVDSLKGEKPSVVKAELKAIGIDLDAADSGGAGVSREEQSKIDALQKTVEALVEDKRAQQVNAVRGIFSESISTLAALKNRTGEPVFPDFQDESEAGMKFAYELGSLTKDTRFQEGVLRRFPDADHTVLVREAYKYLGGKVSGEPVKVSPEATQKHLEKSRRAAASTPGRSASRDDSSNLVGKLSNRAALAKAFRDVRDRGEH